MSGEARERAERLRAWLDDYQISARLGCPQYANPGELKADLRALLAEQEALQGELKAAEEERDEAWNAHHSLAADHYFGRAERAEERVAACQEFLQFLVDLDDPRAEMLRRTVTLTEIIDRAKALRGSSVSETPEKDSPT